MSDQICPGPCNGRFRRESAAYEQDLAAHHEAVRRWDAGEDPADTPPVEPEPPRGNPWYGNPVWCGVCLATIRQELAELDDLASIYAARSDGHRETTSEGRVSGTHNPPSLSPVVEDLDELEGWLRAWRAVYSNAETQARQGYLASSITTNVCWLLTRAEHILARHEYGEDFGRETRSWHSRLAMASKASVVVHRKPLRCPRCDMLRLEYRDGEDSVTCANPDCRRVLRLAEYDALVEQTVGARKSLR